MLYLHKTPTFYLYVPCAAGIYSRSAYVCQNFVCQLPTNDLAVLSSQLDSGKPAATDERAKQDAGKQ
jgi:hypothetical protein